MTRNTAPTASGQPTLEELMVRFLASRSDAAAAAVEPLGEVEPYEVAAGFRVDPRAAWTDAVSPLAAARPDHGNPGVNTPGSPNTGSPVPPTPPEWPGLVGQPAAAFAVACAAGNFPQRVKDLQPLLNRFAPAELRPGGNGFPAPGLSGLRAWVVKQAKTNQPAAVILAAGVARAMGELDWAEELLKAVEPAAGDGLRPAWENERAALLWDRGRSTEALAAWDALPDSPAVLFNRGMARLFLGKSAEARPMLAKAAEAFPETNGWHALARLYLTLSEIHG
jgi:hypothetical protein